MKDSLNDIHKKIKLLNICKKKNIINKNLRLFYKYKCITCSKLKKKRMYCIKCLNRMDGISFIDYKINKKNLKYL